METVFVYTREQAIEDGILMRFEDYFRNAQEALTHEERIQFSELMERLKREIRKPKFLLGELIITTNAAGKLDALQAFTVLARHQSGDWGDVCEFDWQLNDEALYQCLGLFSVYEVTDKEGDALQVYVITECSHEATTILLPEDY